MLTSVSKLPQVSKRDRTEIQEFSLSRTNKTGRENPSESNTFKARPLDKKILEVQQFKPTLDRSQKTEMSPFNLKVEERAKIRTKEISQTVVQFKARNMPKYNFFELEDVPKPVTEFSEFKLHGTPKKARRSISFKESMA